VIWRGLPEPRVPKLRLSSAVTLKGTALMRSMSRHVKFLEAAGVLCLESGSARTAEAVCKRRPLLGLICY
jgi:hypothetical protein